jgi:hypothetical protein
LRRTATAPTPGAPPAWEAGRGGLPGAHSPRSSQGLRPPILLTPRVRVVNKGSLPDLFLGAGRGLKSAGRGWRHGRPTWRRQWIERPTWGRNRK